MSSPSSIERFRNSKHPAYAAVDIGSHTIRLLVAERIDGNLLVPVHGERHVVRLAESFAEHGVLDSEAKRRAMAVLSSMMDRLERRNPRRISCGATGVVRKAPDGAEFVEEVRRVTGLRVAVLSETEEARLSFQGMSSVLERNDRPMVAFDLGGSSTEFCLALPRKEEPVWMKSFFVGAATLTERFFPESPVPDERLEAARVYVRSFLEEAARTVSSLLHRSGWTKESGMDLVGTAGTVTTLAAIRLGMTEYVPYRVNGLRLSLDWISEIVARLASLSIEQRREIPGLEPGREDIIMGGAVIVQEILHSMDCRELVVTDAGLLEGLLLDAVRLDSDSASTGQPTLTWRFKWD